MRSSDNNILRKNQLTQVFHQQQREQEKSERELFKQTHAIVPTSIRSSLFFSGSVRIVVQETNELELRSEDHEIKLEAKPQSRIEVNCRQRIKKLNIPKRHQEINAQAYLQQDDQKSGILQNEQTDNDALVQNQMIYGVLGEALMKSGAQLSLVKTLSQNVKKQNIQIRFKKSLLCG